MKERPIIFSGEMVRAILAGTKTLTRRLVGLETLRESPTPGYDLTFRGQAPVRSLAQQQRGPKGCWQDMTRERLLELCPYGVAGDRLWVRETWAPEQYDADAQWEVQIEASRRAPAYAADFKGCPAKKWRPSIHMPRRASRLTLEVTSVRVERLQDISEEDARAEGCSGSDPQPAAEGGTSYVWKGRSAAPDPRAHFAALWDSINGKRAPWASNPWVWVIGFRHLDSTEAGVSRG